MSAAHWSIPLQPVAAPNAIVISGQARFTVLTARLIRMEYSPNAVFEDRASQVFWHRRQPVPAFTVNTLAGGVEIITDGLHLRYSGAFNSGGLQITLLDSGLTWHFGQRDLHNLGGTARTLDQIAYPEYVQMSDGLMSRAGWSVVDDSASFLLDADGWVVQREAADRQDLYFFGYGQDYKTCLQDFHRIAGQAPLVPHWMLGNWWSRYHRYTQDGILALVQRFEAEHIPLAVFVIDMDWHITQTGNASSGWTGYTWNRDLFPNPPALIQALHAAGLKTCLNVHPADGVWPHEAAYAQMAEALDIDPTNGAPIPFHIHNAAFTEAYFEHLHHPQEAIGIDFWWLDWQHDSYQALPDFDPLLWLNHLHALDIARNGDARPFTVSRWGGLGNHRYPMAFSGDTFVMWEVLEYLPYFTATAANIGCSWWSHDIGGHFWGIQEPELYLRWLQYGVLSPVNRLHSSSNPYEERHPWGYGADILSDARTAMQLRHELLPYLYTMAHRTHVEALPLCAPMYYEHPQQEEAYACPHQYMFGTSLIAAPFVQKMNAELQLSRQVVWLPEGQWVDFFSGEALNGGTWHARYGDLSEIPLFASAGAIIPLHVLEKAHPLPDTLALRCFVGAAGTFTLYEDDGETLAYINGAYSTQTLTQGGDATHWWVTCDAVQGDAPSRRAVRHYAITLVGIADTASFQLTDADGMPIAHRTQYDAEKECCTLTFTHPAQQAFRLDIHAQGATIFATRDRRAETLLKLLRAFRMDNAGKLQLQNLIPALLQDPMRLFDNHVFFSAAQLTAFLEVLLGAGVDRIQQPGDGDVIRLWNASGTDLARYGWSTWNFEQRFLGAHGTLPRSAVMRFPNDRQWKIQVGYGGLHSQTYQNELLRYRPGSTQVWLESGYRAPSSSS
ncbi:MAG: TIM-barrel domain-containing protein [Phototrophicaceae bacterium]